MRENENKTLELYVHDASEKGIKCSVDGIESHHFWLPKSKIQPLGRVFKNQTSFFIVPNWLAAQHRQIVGNQVYEAVKQQKNFS